MLTSLRRSDRAATLAFTAVAAVVLLGSAALAVDLGMLISARVQSQRAADSGALAGALQLATEGFDETDARNEAKKFANDHNVLTNAVVVEDADVDIEGDTVRVRVHHAINTMFARVLGIDQVNVSTVAAAEAVPAAGAECPLPIVAVDRWHDAVSLGGDGDGLYDEGETYIPCTGENPPANCTGYDLTDDIGTLIEVKSSNNSSPSDSTAQTCGAEDPSWFCWINDVNGTSVGTPELEDAINGCVSGSYEFGIGDVVTSSPGNKQSVVQEAKTFIDNNSGPYWDPSLSTQGCVTLDGNECVEGHARIRPFAVVDPRTIQGTGSGSEAVIIAMASIFMEKVASDDAKPHGQDPPPGQWNLYLRFNGKAAGGTGEGDNADQGLFTVRLIE